MKVHNVIANHYGRHFPLLPQLGSHSRLPFKQKGHVIITSTRQMRGDLLILKEF